MVQSHCESSPGSLDECRLSAGWLPTLRPSVTTWAVSPLAGCYHPHPPSPVYYYSIIKSRRLTIFGRLARMVENADASQAIFKPPPENWRWPPGRSLTCMYEEHSCWHVFVGDVMSTCWHVFNIHVDMYSLDLGIDEARDLVQSEPLWRLMSAQRYALVAVLAPIGLDWKADTHFIVLWKVEG